MRFCTVEVVEDEGEDGDRECKEAAALQACCIILAYYWCCCVNSQHMDCIFLKLAAFNMQPWL
jgi:hypothetical protein